MKKHVIYMIGILLLVLCVLLPLHAADAPARLLDEADLLTDGEEAVLLTQLDEISVRQGMDVVIVTVSETGDRTVVAYADDTYDYSGYAADGILLLISVDAREWAISTAGYGITAFTDAGLDYLSGQIGGAMSAGEWNTAFLTFADLCDGFITQARSGAPYDVGNLPGDGVKKPFNPLLTGIVSLVIGFAIAFFRMNRWKNQLLSVQKEAAAASYVKEGSMQLTEQRDRFLFRHVDRHEKSTSNAGGSSTHVSSSGNTHGGASGSF